VEDAKGNSYVMTGTVLKKVQIPYERGGNLSILNENLSQFTCGDRTGYGTAEYLVRIE
jgi:hypothetical protein